MTKLFLHVGMHKCGTTTIQKFAEANREALSERGLLYPNERDCFHGGSKEAHHLLARRVVEDGDGTRAVAKQWVAKARELGTDILLSSESIARHVYPINRSPQTRASRREYVSRLADVFQDLDCETQIVLIFRNPVDFVQSMYQEFVRIEPRRRWRDFAKFRQDLLTREFSPLHYEQNRRDYAERFEHVTCHLFDELVAGGDLVAEFFGRLGFVTEGLCTEKRSRESASVLVTHLKSFASSNPIKGERNLEFYDWLASDHVTSAIREIVGQGPFDLWESAEARAAFQEKLQPEIRALSDACFGGQEIFPERDFKRLHGRSLAELPEAAKARLLQLAFGLP